MSAVAIPTVADVTRHHARMRPDQVALHFEGQKITYDALDRRANQAAQGLIAAGVTPQARVAILAKNCPAFFELWFGAAKANAVLVPVNFRLAPPEIAYVVNDAKAELLFVGSDFHALVGSVERELGTARELRALDGQRPTWPDYA